MLQQANTESLRKADRTVRELTRFEREVLLTTLRIVEERSEALKNALLTGVEILVSPSLVAQFVQEKRMRDQGVAVRNVDDADVHVGAWIASGVKSLPGAVREFRSLTESISRCMRRLADRRLLLKRVRRVKSSRVFYVLSPVGRLLAERIRAEGDRGMDGFLQEAVNKLWDERISGGQPPYATPEEIIEALWHNMQGLYGGERKLFDRCWNRVTLGRKMKDGGYKLVHARLNGKQAWVYDLYRHEDQKRDLMAALVALRRRNFWRVRTCRIRESLWETCGTKFRSKDLLEKVWDEKRIGKLMHELGFRPHHKRDRMLEEAAGAYFWVYKFFWCYDIRAIPKEEEVVT